MYRTDKQFMKNPATAPCRIYIGGLAKTVIANDLEEKFKPHGTIAGLSLNTGFAFIQFDSENEAQAAIKAENGTMLCGRKIIVKQAMDKSKPNQTPQRPNQGPPQRSPIQSVPPKPAPQKTPPPPPQNLKSDEPDFDQESGDDFPEDDRPNIKPPAIQRHNDDKGFNRGGRRDVGSGDKPRDRDYNRFGGRFEPPPKIEPFRDNRDREAYMRDMDFQPPSRNDPYMHAPMFEPPPAPVDKNDCEIIVVAKQLTNQQSIREYAEFIEQKLKTQGLIVDLLFPNEDVPIGKVLANISSRGCLYAILIMPVNEERRSLTLNILHGVPQEHRNMPIEDAMILISRDFENYMKAERIPTDPSQMTLLDRHPTQMQILLNLLSENRQIYSLQYDKLITYLKERRVLQHEYELEEGITPNEEGDSKQAELQNRIMNILNKSEAPPAPEPPSNEPTPILKDPTVQKALDSLMLGDMFKNIAG
ncbi:uncharacterized protein Neos isoform X1 [Diabrotica undecimpunctata]|uniref:uncharacterized protein Neos isoform X1 n=1 Tax=Diabrotica undecimpunctata TaxID=50387 RepID=UPI003B63EC6D